MDEDDLVAIVTRRLITDHEFFRTPHPEQKSFRVLTKGKNLKSGAPHFTSLQTLYEVNKTLLMTTERRRQWGRAKDWKVFLQFRPEENEIDRYCQTLSNCWDALLRAVSILSEAAERMRTHDLPDSNPDGYRDHLLFWPIGQELFAETVRPLLDGAGLGDDAEVASMEAALGPLAEVPWDLHNAPWCYLLLVPTTPEEDSWRMRSEDRKLALDLAGRLLRWIVGLDALDEDDMSTLRKDWKNLLYPEPPEENRIQEMWREISNARAGIVTRG